MKIGNYEMGLQSEYQSKKHLEITQTSKRIKPGTQETEEAAAKNGKIQAFEEREDGSVKLSQEALSFLQRNFKTNKADVTKDAGSMLDSKILILKKTVEALTGKKINLGAFDPTSFRVTGGGSQVSSDGLAEAAAASNQVTQEVTQSYFYEESESVSFAAYGAITTEDGKEFGFSLEFALSRSYSESGTNRFTQTVNLCDPLVLNFEGSSAELRENAKVNFDLDADGTVEEISFVGPGSGFLALDSHNDKTVHDGSQLFGTKSGDGFSDLAKYDQDGNHWIDENDDVYARLLIWSMDANGNQRVQTLKEANVGAIYLGSVGTQFSMKGSDQSTTLGEMRSSGVFLTEDGKARTVQQVDLAV